MAILFNQRVKHGQLDFHPGVVYGFEDEDAEPYFVACGWASETTNDIDVMIRREEIDIDPCTVFNGGDKHGQFVMPDRAAAQRGTSIEEAQAFRWSGEHRDELHNPVMEGDANG